MWDVDDRSSGCGILVKKERDCGMRNSLSQPWTLAWNYRSHQVFCSVMKGMASFGGACGIFIPVTSLIHCRWFTILVYTPYLYGTPHPVWPKDATPVRYHLSPVPWHIKGPVKSQSVVCYCKASFLPVTFNPKLLYGLLFNRVTGELVDLWAASLNFAFSTNRQQFSIGYLINRFSLAECSFSSGSHMRSQFDKNYDP